MNLDKEARIKLSKQTKEKYNNNLTLIESIINSDPVMKSQVDILKKQLNKFKINLKEEKIFESDLEKEFKLDDLDILSLIKEIDEIQKLQNDDLKGIKQVVFSSKVMDESIEKLEELTYFQNANSNDIQEVILTKEREI